MTLPLIYRGRQSVVLRKSFSHCGQLISGLRSLKQKIQKVLFKEASSPSNLPPLLRNRYKKYINTYIKIYPKIGNDRTSRSGD